MPSPLKSSRLRRILFAYTVNRLGTWVGLVALSLAVFDHTHSALAVAALLFAWQALPAFLVPAVVARVESRARRGELSALYVFEGRVTAALAVLLWHFCLPSACCWLCSTGRRRWPLTHCCARRWRGWRAIRSRGSRQVRCDRARISTTEAQEAERKANAALNIAFSLAFVTGPVIGGAVVAAAGAPAALFINVGSFLICGALLIDLHPHVELAGKSPYVPACARPGRTSTRLPRCAGCC